MDPESATTAVVDPPDTAAAPTLDTTNHKPEWSPLWPIPLEILGLTGEYASGKTLFGMTIAPGPDTLVFDIEKSAGSYASLGCDRVDMPAEMNRAKPRGFRPMELFLYWRDRIRGLPPNKYRVILIDPVSEIESGLVEYVRKNPADFGYTAAQFARGEALVWGAMKDAWKAVLADVAARCETFAFTSHMREKFAGGAPSGKREPKGKETLMELASVYLLLDRTPDKKGNVPAAPSAVVLKSRLAATRVNPETGEVEIVPVLPPRLPKATPAVIREYMRTPPNYSKLAAGERAPEERQPTEADVERMKLARAEADRDAEALRLDQLNRRQQLLAAAGDGYTPTPTPTVAPTVGNAAPPTTAPAKSANGKATGEQIRVMLGYRGQLGIDDATWSGILAKRNVKRPGDLTENQAEKIISALGEAVAAEMGLDGPPPADEGEQPGAVEQSTEDAAPGE